MHDAYLRRHIKKSYENESPWKVYVQKHSTDLFFFILIIYKIRYYIFVLTKQCKLQKVKKLLIEELNV